MAITPVTWSHYNDPNRDRTPPTTDQKNVIVNKLIQTSSAAGLNTHDIAYVLALVEFESGFNPNAANPTSSAVGLGQFIDSTGSKFKLTGNDRWDVDLQIQAVVEHFIENKAIAEKNNLGDAGIYGAHHDGAAGVLKVGAPGLELARTKVLPKIDAYEKLVQDKIESGEVNSPANSSTSAPTTPGTFYPDPMGENFPAAIMAEAQGGTRSDTPSSASSPNTSSSIYTPKVTKTADGGTETEYIAKTDSADGSVKRGDLVIEVANKDKVVTLRSVDHKADNSTEVYSNENGTQTYDRWDGSGRRTDSLVKDATGVHGTSREVQPSNPMGDGNPLQYPDPEFPSSALTGNSALVEVRQARVLQAANDQIWRKMA